MFKKWLNLAACLPACATFIRADVVEMRNGDRLSGTISMLNDGKLRLATSYAGTVLLRSPLNRPQPATIRQIWVTRKTTSNPMPRGRKPERAVQRTLPVSL